MINKKIYPEWVEKEHVPGTSIKQIKDNYYLYSCTSKQVKGKKYPVSIQRYIGKITKDGLIKAETVSFVPLKDSLVLLADEFDVSDIKNNDRKVIEKICLLKHTPLYYLGKISSKEIKVLSKYFIVDEGVLIERSR